MIILGLSGGIDTLHSNDFALSMETLSHDSAAALMIDGTIIAAVEEERLSRIKHTNLFPENAINFVLQHARIKLDDVDIIAIYLNEMFLALGAISRQIELGRSRLLLNIRSVIAERLRESTTTSLSVHEIAAKLRFFDHHLCHARSATPFANPRDSLVFITDGIGEETSGFIGRLSPEGDLEVLDVMTRGQSIGIFYLVLTRYLGFAYQDEYKVMGMSSYGNPAAYAELVRSLYRKTEPGRYEFFSTPEINANLLVHIPPRAKGAEITQGHKDLAASLQQVVEEVIIDILRHWVESTGIRALIMAGGVAQNSAANGRVLNSGLFDEIFVTPVSHDAGCALGAAVLASEQAGVVMRTPMEFNPFLGPDIGEAPTVFATLKKWALFIEPLRSSTLEKDVAILLTQDNVIGWVQGRAEYGPRALGNRSILADPRPSANRERINRIVKHREGFRPFAPAVLFEYITDLFDIPQASCKLDFMTHIVKVRPPYDNLLGAVTHVNGSARIQSVTRQGNERFWTLISEFNTLTECPALLNTSFNNHAEPIVTTADEAISNFLTCEMDVLVIGDYIIRKRAWTPQDLLQLKVSIPAHILLRQDHDTGLDGRLRKSYGLCSKVKLMNYPISEHIYNLLASCQNRDEQLASLFCSWTTDLMQEILTLWFERLITLKP